MGFISLQELQASSNITSVLLQEFISLLHDIEVAVNKVIHRGCCLSIVMSSCRSKAIERENFKSRKESQARGREGSQAGNKRSW
jgi:hypothetical protein